MVSSVKFRQKILIDKGKCITCCECINVCREESLGILNGAVKQVNTDQCSRCEDCIDICENNAIKLEWDYET